MENFPRTSEDLDAIVAKLQQQAHDEHKARISPGKLNDPHRHALVQAINNVLSTEIAFDTYAQIIDGLPTAEVGFDRRSHHICDGHAVDEHVELCPGAMEKAREFCPKWHLDMLAFNPQLIRDFRNAAPGTKVFATRLIELVAVAIHQFGALLYQLDFRVHQGDVDAAVTAIEPRPDYIKPELWGTIIPPPTIFYHIAYQCHDIYPEGVADMVGYWVEDRIFGGVVVFDRPAEQVADGNRNPNPPNIYLHPCRDRVTRRITQLSDEQQQALVDFFTKTGPEPPSSSPLPIIVGYKNRRRVDPEVAIVNLTICRDVWERKPPTLDEYFISTRRPRSSLDYPETLAFMILTNVKAGNKLPEKLKDKLRSGELDDELGPDKKRLDLDKLLSERKN